MSMLKNAIFGAALMPLAAAATAQTPMFGQQVPAADVALWDISIGPDGAGLPPGQGTVAQGEAVFAAKCQACHGEKGIGRPKDTQVGVLAGGSGSLAPDKVPVKTIGSYWPYATTLFDYVRRAMPFQNPKSLSDDEVYAVSAYLLNLNGIIAATDVINATSLPKVRMPNRDGFVVFPRNPKQ
jgi:mono/diheme cytochrome c family protein